MAESRYGRLFTEAEIARAAIYAATRALGLPIEKSPDGKLLSVVVDADEAAREALAQVGDEAIFPPDEPLVLLRGQDGAAPDAIVRVADLFTANDYYISAARHGASTEHLDRISAAAKAMREWQAANPDRVKDPD